MSSDRQEKPTIGIILFEMGHPQTKEEIKPFLEEVFNDPNLVMSLSPQFWAEKYLKQIQPYIATYLARYWTKKLALKFDDVYQWDTLHHIVQEQARALEEHLLSDGHRVKVFPTMRYGSPSIESVLTHVRELNIDKLILLPLFPQFSWLTTGSFIQAFDHMIEEMDLREELTIRTIPHYHSNIYYIMTLSEQIDAALEKYFDEEIRFQVPLMFTARSIPEKMILEHDPYQDQLENTIELIQEHLGIPNPVYLTFHGQMKFLQWVGPDTLSMIDYLADKEVPGMLFIPLGLSSEQYDTEVKLEQTICSYALQKGIQPVHRLKTLNNNKFFISTLKQVIIEDLHVIKNTSLIKN